MPQINLLSPGTQKKETRIVSSREVVINFAEIAPVVIFRSSICIGICVVLWIGLYFQISKKQKVLKELDVKLQALEENPKEMEKIKTERAALEKKVKLIDELSSRKFLWYEKLDILADLVPSGIWLNEVYSKREKMSDNELAQLKESGKGSVLGEKTILMIRGTAVAYKIEDAVALVGDFIKTIEANKEFSKDFVIRPSAVSKGSIGGVDVMKFDLICESKN